MAEKAASPTPLRTCRPQPPHELVTHLSAAVVLKYWRCRASTTRSAVRLLRHTPTAVARCTRSGRAWRQRMRRQHMAQRQRRALRLRSGSIGHSTAASFVRGGTHPALAHTRRSLPRPWWPAPCRAWSCSRMTTSNSDVRAFECRGCAALWLRLASLRLSRLPRSPPPRPPAPAPPAAAAAALRRPRPRSARRVRCAPARGRDWLA